MADGDRFDFKPLEILHIVILPRKCIILSINVNTKLQFFLK